MKAFFVDLSLVEEKPKALFWFQALNYKLQVQL